jgi:spore photoproduct lyase
MKRHKPKGLSIPKNVNQILTEINTHAVFAQLETKKPNQTHSKYITYDIGCNEDFALHLKHHEWKRIFDFFKHHDKVMGTFATKYVNPELLKYNPNEKIRIRFSLMPESKRKLHEPNTSTIQERIEAIDQFIEAGYDVHVNFSPIIVYDGWLYDYDELFCMLDKEVKNKSKVLAECIFLTHEIEKHYKNLLKHPETEKDLRVEEMQEEKVSQFGGNNIRYRADLKRQFINKFVELHDTLIPWNKIRYIF